MKFMIDVILPAAVAQEVCEYSVSYVEEATSSADAIRAAAVKARERFGISASTPLNIPMAWAVMPSGLQEVFGLVA